jgi:nitrogen fixation NifU-like protein
MRWSVAFAGYKASSGKRQSNDEDGLRIVKLEQMYQEVILDHYREKHGSGLRDPFDTQVEHVNPTCGDEIMLRVSLSEGGEGVADVSYDAVGCSISQAAASVMHDLVRGKSVAEFTRAHELFLGLMHGNPIPEADGDFMGDAEVFAGVGQYPARVKCALLPWMAAKDAIAQSLGKTQT